MPQYFTFRASLLVFLCILLLVLIVIAGRRLGCLGRGAPREETLTLALAFGSRCVITPAAKANILSMCAIILSPGLWRSWQYITKIHSREAKPPT